jgi:Ca2+-binding RTX toxin-like protein
VAVASSGNVILTIDKDNGAGNHNGGWMGFGPDGMLHIAVGDEGQGGDPDNNAQDRNELWGKILRIDVRSDGFAGDPNRDYSIPDDNPFVGIAGADEIWALGLRNPWRASFDRLTGDFYIGDVGQGDREEINFQQAGSAGGANYGWKVKEGKLVFDGTVPGNPSPTDPSLIDPVVDYAHNVDGGFAVVGGYVYRGTSPGMQGRYVYADFITNNLWSFRIVNGKAVDVTEHSAQLTGDAVDFQGITSFAEDGKGNLYAIGIDGRIMRLEFGAAAADAADIIDGGSGNDRIFGGAGNDRLSGGTMNDTINGGTQDDRLNGGSGNDTLRGGTGRDTLDGGAGSDLLVGGRSADTFRFDTALGNDTISGFQDNIDTIRLADAFGFSSATEALSLAVETAGNVVFTFSSDQTLTLLDTTKAALGNDLLV